MVAVARACMPRCVCGMVVELGKIGRLAAACTSAAMTAIEVWRRLDDRHIILRAGFVAVFAFLAERLRRSLAWLRPPRRPAAGGWRAASRAVQQQLTRCHARRASSKAQGQWYAVHPRLRGEDHRLRGRRSPVL